jgi:hypothetical protein
VNTNFRASIVAIAIGAALCAGVADVYAQAAGSQRPYAGLFGGSAPSPGARHTLDVSASVFAAYDDSEVADPVSTPNQPFVQSGYYSGFDGELNYGWQGQKIQLGANAVTGIRHYRDQGLVPVGFGVGFGLAAELAQETRLFVNQSVAYTPAYMYGVFPGLGQTPGQVVGAGDPLSDSQVWVYDTSASLTRRVSRRGSVEALGTLRYSDFGQTSGVYRDLTSWSAGGRYRQGVSRYMSLRLGYIYRRGAYGVLGTGRPIVIHDIDAGVDYRRALSLTRRTTFDFGVGSTIVTMPVEDRSELQYRVGGDVGLNHEMGRTWRARVAYNRGFEFSEAFAQPVFSDAVNGSLTGFFSRRVDFRANAGVSIGDVGVGQNANPGSAANQNKFKAYNANARVRVALARSWALFGEYQYYFHDLGDVLIVPTGVPRGLDRNSVSGGLTFWVPVYRR